MEMLTTEWLPRSDSPVREAKTGISSVSPAYRGIKMEWLWSERPLTDPGQKMNTPLNREGTSNDWCRNPISIKSRKNDKRNSDLFFNNKPYKNEKRNSNPLSKVMRKRKTKFLSVFQSDERTKNKKQNSNLFFNVMQKRKTKNGNGIWMPFSHAIEKWLALRCTHCNATQHRRSIKTELWTKISVRFMSSYIL